MSSPRPRPDGPEIVGRFGLLSDYARIRVLRLLEREELSVGELSRALQIPQSTVSRHLKVLHEDGWLVKRADGPSSLYRLVAASLDSGAAPIWTLVRDQLAANAVLAEDDRRLVQVLAERRDDPRSFFSRLGEGWDAVRQDLFGSAFAAESLAALLPPNLIVADLGCGTGNMAALLVPFVQRVILIDREPAMLAAAKQRLDPSAHADFREGDLLAPPLKNGEVDAAIFGLVLHHLEDPGAALSAVRPALRAGGRVIIIDIVPHDREAYRATMGHKHLGFSEGDVRRWANAADLTLERYIPLRPDTIARGPGLFAATLRSE